MKLSEFHYLLRRREQLRRRLSKAERVQDAPKIEQLRGALAVLQIDIDRGLREACKEEHDPQE